MRRTIDRISKRVCVDIRSWLSISMLVLLSCAPEPVAMIQPPSVPTQVREPEVLRLAVVELTARVEPADAAVLSWEEYSGAEALLEESARSKDREIVPALYFLATCCSERVNFRDISLGALDALWRLGESPSSFYRMVDDFAVRPRLASYAMRILSRDPTKEMVARFQSVTRGAEQADMLESERFQSATVEAGLTLSFRNQLNALTSIAKRIDFLARPAIAGFVLQAQGNGSWPNPELESSFSRTEPRTALARLELARISTRFPRDAAKAVRAATFDCACDRIENEYRRNECLRVCRLRLSLYLASESKAIFDAKFRVKNN